METAPDNPLVRRLEKDPAVIYMLDRDLRIVYCNAAWDRFAAENVGRGLGRESQAGRGVLDVIPPPLRRFFQEGYWRAFSALETWEYNYECSSASVYRVFRAMAHPDPTGAELVVVNSISVERPHDEQERSALVPHAALYVDDSGIVTMCCHCRRTRRAKESAVWDWVPAHVKEPPALVSHGICAVCHGLFYPGTVQA